LIERLCAVADLHLREDMPVCRNDADWLAVQREALEFVVSFANEKKASIALSGDLCHKSHVHPSIINLFFQVVSQYHVEGGGIYILAGQHDLLYHNLDNMMASSFGNIWTIAKMGGTPLHPLDDIGVSLHFGEIRESRRTAHADDCACGLGGDCDCGYDDRELVFLHQLTFASKKDMPPTDEGVLAEDLAKMFPDARYICLGDNHRHFLWEKGTQKVVNPGCLVRQSADLVDYQAGFYFIDLVRDEVEFVPVPDKGTVSNDHIKRQQERDERIEAFISTLERGTQVSLDFVQNLRVKMKGVDPSIVDVIERLLDQVGGSK